MESMDFADKQLAFYDFEVFEQDWLVVIKTSAGVTYKIQVNSVLNPHPRCTPKTLIRSSSKIP